MTTATASASASPILDAGDGVTYPRDVALKATRLHIEAFKVLHGATTLDDDDMLVELVYDRVADLLGGPHWMGISKELVEEIVSEERTAA